jgi:hypothetical protein
MPREYLGQLYTPPAGDNRSVPLEGVPQIPDDCERTIRLMGEWALSDEQMTRCTEVIYKQATLEIQRRHLAAKLGVQLDRYFARSAAQLPDRGQELCAGRGLIAEGL